MATSLHFCGVKNPHPSFSRTNLNCQLRFAVSAASLPGLCTRAVETSCTRRVLRVNCEGTTVNQNCDGVFHELTCVMKFGGSSVASSDRMREVADLILSFPEERPVIVLSAMGKTTSKLLLAGEKAVTCGVSNVSDVDEFNFVKELHLSSFLLYIYMHY
ncbi:hypothetical protein CsSME_00004755 [Camellia sinensis var. sinensis]